MSAKNRLSRSRRDEHPPNMRLTQRDFEILNAVADYRILRQDQIQQLFFGSKSTAQYRLSRLYQHGFLARHFLPVYAGWSPTLYSLDKRGLALLKSASGSTHIQLWNSENSHEFLSHTLAITDVRIALTLACRAAAYTLTQWKGEADLKATYDRVSILDAQGKPRSISLIPDSYFTIQTGLGKTSCFLEMDMGTMTIGRFQDKIRAYLAYIRSGKYQERYQSKSLRVLTIANSATRATNLRKAAEGVQAERKFWFTSKEQIDASTVLHHSIWEIAGNDTPSALIPR